MLEGCRSSPVVMWSSAECDSVRWKSCLIRGNVCFPVSTSEFTDSTSCSKDPAELVMLVSTQLTRTPSFHHCPQISFTLTSFYLEFFIQVIFVSQICSFIFSDDTFFPQFCDFFPGQKLLHLPELSAAEFLLVVLRLHSFLHLCLHQLLSCEPEYSVIPLPLVADPHKQPQ